MDALEKLGWQKNVRGSGLIRYSYDRQCKTTPIIAYIDIFENACQIDLYEQIGDEAGYLYLTKEELLALAEIVKEIENAT